MHNKITVIKNQTGERLEMEEAITEELCNHFRDILQEPNHQRQESIREITQHIPKLITKHHNRMLLTTTSLAEVEKEVFQLKEGKAPGPDGFTTNFFHFFWETIQNEVWDVV